MGKSNYSDELRAELDMASRRIASELQKLDDSGATTTDDRQRAYDAWVANLPEAQRAQLIAETADARGQIEAMLTDSGYKGDTSSMNLPDLANLAATRGLLTLEGTATIPTASALDAAVAAGTAGGGFHLNPITGGIWIYRDANLTNLHDYLPGGTEGPPAAVIFDEVASDSDRGGVRPTAAQVDAALRDGATEWSYGPGGEVIGTFPDGSSRSYPNDPFQQGLEDLQHADGRIGDIGSALDGALTRGGDDFFRGIQGAIDDMSRTRYDSIGGSGAAAGMGGATITPGSMTGGGGGSGGTGTSTSDSTSHSTDRPGSGSVNTWDSTLDADVFDSPPTHTGGGTKPAAGSANPTPAPAAAEPNEIVDRSDGDDPVEDDDEDGWDNSTKEPPTDATVPNDGDTDDGKAPQPQPDSDGDGIPDDEDEDTDVLEYTPAPGSDDWRNLSQSEVARMLEAAQDRSDGRQSWWDGTGGKPATWDPEFARALQERKLDMVDNPGSPDVDTGGGGFVPPDTIPEPDPNDDTPGHDSEGVDNGSEEPGSDVQTPLGPGFLEDPTAPLAPQEMVTAEIDPAATAPLEVMVAAEINVEGTPEIPGYVQALGDPVSSAPESEEEPESLMARVDPRLGSQLSIPETFRVASRDAVEDDPDAG